MLLRSRHPAQNPGTITLLVITSIVVHGLLLFGLTLIWTEVQPVEKPQEEMTVRVLNEDSLPESLKKRLAKRVTQQIRKKKKKQDLPKKKKKKFADPKLLMIRPTTAQPEEDPNKAQFSGRYKTRAAQDQIKRGTEGTQRGTSTNKQAPVQTSAPSKQATRTEKDAPTNTKREKGQVQQSDAKTDANNKPIKDFAPEPDIVLPSKQKQAKTSDLKIADKASSGSRNGRPNATAKNLFPTLKNTRPLAKKRGNNGTFNTHKDIPDASRTLLNRKRTRYWTFFSRFHRQVKKRWDPVTVLRKRDPYGNIYGVADRYTIVQVTLKGDGNVHKLHVVKSSGIDFYDDEATRALTAAAPFPNPPEGLKDEDGYIHFKFGFVLTMSTGSSRFFRIK